MYPFSFSFPHTTQPALESSLISSPGVCKASTHKAENASSQPNHGAALPFPSPLSSQPISSAFLKQKIFIFQTNLGSEHRGLRAGALGLGLDSDVESGVPVLCTCLHRFAQPLPLPRKYRPTSRKQLREGILASVRPFVCLSGTACAIPHPPHPLSIHLAASLPAPPPPHSLALSTQVARDEAAMWEAEGGIGFLRLDYDPVTQVHLFSILNSVQGSTH